MHTLQQLTSGELKGITRLRLSCGLTHFPEEIFNLADTLEILDLSGNVLTALPADFARLHKLKIAFFSDNNFTVFPEVLAQCPQLDMIGFKANKINHIPEKALNPNIRWLILTNNQISALPHSIGKCTKLKKLMLAGNYISRLPTSFANCTGLELLRLSANQFTAFPHVLFDLPHLAWLAFGGNPFSNAMSNTHSQKPTQTIDWSEIELRETLGEGASGIISKAIWKMSMPIEVAVKVFKGEVTSDGLPIDEMKACIAAGNHQNRVSVIGKIVNHTNNKQALVMELISPNYTNLAQPPSFDSCTRDVFAPDTQFSTEQILNMARGMALAVSDLHAKGIMHGDLYAHNTLVDEQGHPLFGDFGAAMLYDKHDTALAAKFERLESRAFGYFLDDILSTTLHETDHQNNAALRGLKVLRDDCLATNSSQRPNFSTIVERLYAFGE